jgi:flagellar basal-body rod protein FlgG
MNPALWAAKTGLDAQQTRMTVTSHNLANVNTNGFKKGRAVFEDLLYQNQRQVGAATSQDTQLPSGLHVGTGVRVVATEKMYTQGNMQQTGNALDVAVNGRGFFQVLLPDGTLGYTRDGSFQVSAQGELVTSSGYAVQPGITVPDGAQTVTIFDFINPAGLQPRGENLLLESASSGPSQGGTPGLNGLGLIEQGSLESSNVNVVEELVNMIETQRAYEMNSKAISTTDQMLEYVTNQL